MLNTLEGDEFSGLNGDAKRVLLVEDDDVQREGMAQWLRDHGLVVEDCSTVEQAVATYRDHEFDVVVADLHLHASSGLDLIRQLREMDPCASAVVVTQYADMAAATAALREGAVDFVAKPLMPDDLRAAVQRALGYRALSKKNEQLREALQAQNLQLQQSNELLQAFAGRVAHDLRAPVRASRLWVEFAAEALLSGAIGQAGEYLKSTVKSIGTCTAIIDGLLAFSKSDALQLKLEEFSLSSEVGTIVETCRLDFRDRVFEVTTRVEGSVKGDAVLLGIAITNLIHNAFKYCSQQSTPRVSIMAGQVGRTYRITVKDNGIGMDPSQMGHLFDPFFRLQSARHFSGEGLGLTTVKKIIERHGGTVFIESSVGSGTTAIIDLPGVDTDSQVQREASHGKEPA
jgi:signal transduction histidine kinase